jgi:uncharacterized protein DUF4258
LPVVAKRIKLSGHARFQMRRRQIRHADVLATVRSPGQILPSVKGRRVYQSLLGPARRVLLRVIVKERTTAYHVVTVYKTSNIAKYWRSK